MLDDQPISVYGDGRTRRDYTFVEDIVEGIRSAMDLDGALFEVVNLGSGKPIGLSEMIQALELAFGEARQARAVRGTAW